MPSTLTVITPLTTVTCTLRTLSRSGGMSVLVVTQFMPEPFESFSAMPT